MFRLHEPNDQELDAFLDIERHKEFSYPDLTATKAEPPNHYKIDHNKIKLGSGQRVFSNALRALYSWQMFKTSFTRLYPNVKPQEGVVVAVIVKHLGFYSVNPSRVVYLLNEEVEGVIRVGFAYGTLTSHAERGEERFLIIWNRETNDVYYDLLAFSKPNNWLVWSGYPYVRALQKRFAQESLQAMLRAVKQ